MCHNTHILVKRKMKKTKIHRKKRAEPLFLCGYFGFHHRNQLAAKERSYGVSTLGVSGGNSERPPLF
jgi:hypothetical protein